MILEYSQLLGTQMSTQYPKNNKVHISSRDPIVNHNKNFLVSVLLDFLFPLN